MRCCAACPQPRTMHNGVSVLPCAALCSKCSAVPALHHMLPHTASFQCYSFTAHRLLALIGSQCVGKWLAAGGCYV